MSEGEPRPRLLDLFCGAGGAAMGYHRAGFDVVGVDIRPQPRYPFDFWQADALSILREESQPGHHRVGKNGQHRWQMPLEQFAAVHASPPCQRWSASTPDPGKHPNLITSLRPLLEATGLPYVIENVPAAPMQSPYRLCGSTLALRVRRHRHFETNFPLLVPSCCHTGQPEPVGVYGDHPQNSRVNTTKGLWRARTLDDGQDAMGIAWMTWDELREAIPPAYTELIGAQLLDHLRFASVATAARPSAPTRS